MLLLRPTNTGLTFNEWQDAIHDVPDQSVIGSPEHDPTLNIVDKEYLRLELQYRKFSVFDDLARFDGLPQTIIPKGLLGKRGIGNWKSPKVIIMLEKIVSHLRGPTPLWNDIPRYRRLRPMSGVRHDRAKLIALLQAATGVGSAEYQHFQPREEKTLLDCYITVFDKTWYWNQGDPIAALIDELSCFSSETPIIAILKNESMGTLWKIARQKKLYHIPSGTTWDKVKKRSRTICLGL